MLRIWGREAALNVQKVLWCADEIGLAYERIDAGQQFGVIDTPRYRALNPNGRGPTLEDGELVLWESNAIVRYLCAKYSMGALCPEPLDRRADVDRWMDWQAVTLFYPAFRTFYINTTRDVPDGPDTDQLETLRHAIIDKLGILERHLTTRRYVGGDSLTMGDIPLGVVIDKWLRMPIARPGMPAVEQYYARLNESGAYRRRVVEMPIAGV